MPGEILGMSRITISNGRVSELLSKEVREKPYEKWGLLAAFY